MTGQVANLSLSLPADFRIVAAQDGVPTEATSGTPPTPAVRDWLASVEASFAATGALLCAVHVEMWQGVAVAASLVVAARPLVGEQSFALPGLRALAQARATPAGQVSLLELPAGPAIGLVDLVEGQPSEKGLADDSPTRIGLAQVQLPLPAHGALLTLTLCTPRVDLLPTYAAVLGTITSRLQLDVHGLR